LAALGLGVLGAGAAQAAEAGVTLQGGWLRSLVAGRPAGGYFTLTNASGTDRLLTGASSPDCASVMLHRSVQQSGQDRMEMVSQVKVPAHGAVHFAPGGYHLMCMQPAAAIHPGAQVPMTLSFADGGQLQATFAVKGATGQ
jgi:copper(I)-binding protein